jgi:predicted negative regulator of RcsB-dependent stress response
MRTIKALVVLVLIGGAGLLGYAYFGDMKPEFRPVAIDVPLQ